MPGQTANITPIAIGLVGVSPSAFLMTTTFTNDEIQAPGFLNGLMTSAQKFPTSGDFIMANASDGPSYYVVTSSPTGVLTLKAAGGTSGGGFEYVNTLWAASNGNDANLGKSQDEPLQTPAGIHAKLVAGALNVVNIVDSGTYSFATTFSLVNTPLFINAPGATFNWTGGASGMMFSTDTVSPLILNVGYIDGTNTLQIVRGFSSIILTGPGGYCNTVNTARIWEDAHTVSGAAPEAIFNIDTDADGGDFRFSHFGQQVINAINLGQSTISSLSGTTAGTQACQINANYFDGSLTGNADFNLNVTYLGADFSNSTTGVVNLRVSKSATDIRTLSGNFAGSVDYVPVNTGPFLFRYNNFFSPISMINQPILGELYDVFFTSTSSPFSFSPGSAGNARDGSNQQIQLPFINGTIVLPDAVLNNLPQGYRFTAAQSVPSGVLVQCSGSDTLSGQNSVGPGATTAYTGIGICEFVVGPSNGAGGVAWIVDNLYTTNTFFQGFNATQSANSPALTHTNLASAGIVPIVTAARATSQYQISGIFLNGVGGTNFSGGGGDRNLHIVDGVHEYTLIPAATLQALSNSGWGSVAVPYPALVAINQATAAGANIYAEYVNGTTDYTAGSVTVSLLYERVTF